MEDKDPAKLITELERYQEVIGYYRKDPSRVNHNREKLLEIQNSLFNLSPIYLNLQFGEETGDEISGLVSTMDRGLIKLLLEN